MTFIKIVPPLEWDREVENDSVLLFDKTGALLGGGTFKTEDDNVLLDDRWILSLIKDWADNNDQDQEVFCEYVSTVLCGLIKTTIAQLGDFVAMNEQRWHAKYEGVLDTFNHLGITKEFIAERISNEIQKEQSTDRELNALSA